MPSRTDELHHGGALALTNPTNSYTLGTIVNGNSEVIVGTDSALGLFGNAPVFLGNVSSGGTLGINAPSFTRPDRSSWARWAVRSMRSDRPARTSVGVMLNILLQRFGRSPSPAQAGRHQFPLDSQRWPA
jgi:hypothetical protein